MFESDESLPLVQLRDKSIDADSVASFDLLSFCFGALVGMLAVITVVMLLTHAVRAWSV